MVNALDACDLKGFCIGLYEAMNQGRRFMCRTAAGFVKEFGAISQRPLLAREEMVSGNCRTGGIIVVGLSLIHIAGGDRPWYIVAGGFCERGHRCENTKSFYARYALSLIHI